MGRLDGKVALVSGGARGMGQAEARLLAAEGANVVVADVVDDEGQAVVESIGEAARYQHLDVTREDDWASAVAATTEAFGSLDVLVNNAGIADGGLLEDTELARYQRVIDVNQTGVFLGMRAVTPVMKAAGRGSIVNISSIDGMIGMNLVIAYVASKWAVRGMTKTAAIELGEHGIRVNSIHPGFIVDTELGSDQTGDSAGVHALLDAHTEKLAPMKRSGKPDEIARLALFLASDESSYSTGSEFVADGGLIAGYPAPGTI